jgi:hypothetical protein
MFREGKIFFVFYFLQEFIIYMYLIVILSILILKTKEIEDNL